MTYTTVSSRHPLGGNDAATTTPPTYQLQCLGCPWHVDAPREYLIARAIVWAHQHKPANGRAHVVEFVPAESGR